MDSSAYTPSQLFSLCDVLCFVLDAQDPPYTNAIKYFVEMIQKAVAAKKDIKIFVLINKVDKDSGFFTEEQRSELRNSVTSSVMNSIDRGVEVSFHLTSIYDYSVFEAFSKIQQQLIAPETLRFLENMLDSLTMRQTIQSSKAYLFDVSSK